MAVPRVYVRRGTTVWIGTYIHTSHSLTQDALTLIFLYLYTIGPKGAIMRIMDQLHKLNCPEGACCVEL